MNRLKITLVAILLASLASAADRGGEVRAARARPNVVLIVCDDLNDWIGPLAGHPQAHTPNLDRFATTATNFRNAACNTPVCAPSRSSFLTGIYPQTSGNLFWKPWHQNEILANSKTVMHHFRDNGYRVAGAGKLMHHQRPAEWDELPLQADYGPIVFQNDATIAHPAVRAPFADIGAIDGSFGPLGDPLMRTGDGPRWVYGRKRYREGKPGERVPFNIAPDGQRDPTPDEKVADWAVRRLERFAQERPTQPDQFEHPDRPDHPSQPFFMGIGFIRPHTPMHAPDEYFDMFPLEDIQLPEILLDDEADTHYREHYLPSVKGLRYHRLISEAYGSREEGLRHFVRAYLACTAFVDHEIGRVLDAIDASPFADNTIVIITSDHGFNMGEKGFLFKNALWEESARIPLLVRAPGVGTPNSVNETPVSLIDIYPTLVDLCALEGDTRMNEKGRSLDGFSLRPLLEDPQAGSWEGPDASITMLHAEEESRNSFSDTDDNDPAMQHWSLRTKRWRYIRYNAGQEELYDHERDPNEWHNLAARPEAAPVLEQMRARLRDRVGIPAPSQPTLSQPETTPPAAEPNPDPQTP